MKRLARSGLLIVASCAFSLCAQSARADLFGAEWFGYFYRIDHATAKSQYVGGAPISLNSMAMDASGTIYTTGREASSPWETYLFTIDPGTGATKRGPRTTSTSALAFSPEGRLFAMRTDSMKNDLYTLDIETGALTLVGYPGVAGIQTLDFSPNGTLYGFDAGYASERGIGLVTIDPITGLATDVDPMVHGNPSEVQSIAFAPDGTLYGASENLYTVDVNSGALTLVGPIQGIQGDIRGMVWIPEPSTLTALATLAAALLLAHLCRRRQCPGSR